MNRKKIQSTLFEALRKAGKILRSSLGERRVIEKKSELSLVTAADKAAEACIVKIIRKAFPDHSLLTEESPPFGNSHCRWIIDPLDGTTNFAHTYPVACVSIGFEENGRLEMGGVFDPFRDELFFAARGKGAALNNRPLRVSKTGTLSESLLCTGFPYDRREKADEYLPIFKAFMMKVQGIRRTGAAALDLCYVAAGRFDGFWELKLQPWDKAAAMLIIEEAGGVLSNFSGRPLTLNDIQNAASNSLIHQEMLEVLKPFQRVGK